METNAISRMNDLHIAAWLRLKGLLLQNMERTDVRRSYLVLSDRQHRPGMLCPAVSGQAIGNLGGYVYHLIIQTMETLSEALGKEESSEGTCISEVEQDG